MSAPRKAGSTGDRPDFLTAALFVGFGALGLWAGRDLTLGTVSAMGPGYLPRVVCWLLIVVGAAVGGLGLFWSGRLPSRTMNCYQACSPARSCRIRC